MRFPGTSRFANLYSAEDALGAHIEIIMDGSGNATKGQHVSWEFTTVVERIGRVLESAGIVIILIGATIATVLFLYQMRQGGTVDAAYVRYRRALGRAVLLGLEFLLAGDIVRTVAIDPTFRSVGILAVIVAIRTFLSIELELEIDGRWPWQQRRQASE